MTSRFAPECSILSLHGSIMKDEYNREWFKQFNIVVNALDNRQVSDDKIMYKTKRPIDGASKILIYAILTVRCLLLLLLVTNNMYLTESYTIIEMLSHLDMM